MSNGIQNELTSGQRVPTTVPSFMHMRQSISSKMPDCCSWLTRSSCCRRQSQQTYIYLYSPTMSGSSSSSSSPLFHCLVCVLFGFCLGFIFILTAVVIHQLTSSAAKLSSESNVNAHLSLIAKKRQLPDFVNTNIDPCEHFYDFVCDKRTRQEKGERHERRWTHIRHWIHDKLMVNVTSSQPRSSASNVSASLVRKFYQLCETQSPTSLLDELERSLALFIEQEPYRSYLTLFNQTNSTTSASSTIRFQYNPFFRIGHSSSNNQSISTITRIHRRPIPSPLTVFPDLAILNQTALASILQFDEDYTKFLLEENHMTGLYNKEYSQESLLMKRILSFSTYRMCLSSANKTDGLQNLIQLLNHFLRYRLNHLNTKLIDKQIRVLDKITDNHTLIEHLKRIRLEFKIIEQIIPLSTERHTNSSCIINLLDRLLDDRITTDDLPPHINFYSPYTKTTKESFLSSDWPYLIMLHDRLLKNISADVLVNYVFYDYYRHLISPYYQPHIHRTETNESYSSWHNTTRFNGSCHVNSCFDVLNCYHPSLLNQVIDDQNQISLESVKTTVHNLIHRFRVLIEQSDHLFIKEKNRLLNELNQMKLLLGHYSPLFQTPPPNLNSSSYFEYVQLLSFMPYDQHTPSYSTELVYYPSNHTLFLPYGFLFLTNSSVEYPVIKILLEILSRSVQSNPFYIECLTKSSDEWNSTTIDTNLEHMIYLLYRSKFLSDKNILLDEYLWPFMSSNALMKRFLIEYTANSYCHSSNASHLFQNNTYLVDDVHLVFHCQQASSIQQSKCSVN